MVAASSCGGRHHEALESSRESSRDASRQPRARRHLIHLSPRLGRRRRECINERVFAHRPHSRNFSLSTCVMQFYALFVCLGALIGLRVQVEASGQNETWYVG